MNIFKAAACILLSILLAPLLKGDGEDFAINSSAQPQGMAWDFSQSLPYFILVIFVAGLFYFLWESRLLRNFVHPAMENLFMRSKIYSGEALITEGYLKEYNDGILTGYFAGPVPSNNAEYTLHIMSKKSPTLKLKVLTKRQVTRSSSSNNHCVKLKLKVANKSEKAMLQEYCSKLS